MSSHMTKVFEEQAEYMKALHTKLRLFRNRFANELTNEQKKEVDELLIQYNS